MIAVDTNLLVYAHRSDSRRHETERAALAELAGNTRPWAVPWPCIHEFLGVVANPRIHQPPTPTAVALAAVRALASTGRARFIGETGTHHTLLTGLLERSGVLGAKVHDARIAAICLGHGVDELRTADRDFSYFPELRTRNPLVAGA